MRRQRDEWGRRELASWVVRRLRRPSFGRLRQSESDEHRERYVGRRERPATPKVRDDDDDAVSANIRRHIRRRSRRSSSGSRPIVSRAIPAVGRVAGRATGSRWLVRVAVAEVRVARETWEAGEKCPHVAV